MTDYDASYSICTPIDFELDPNATDDFPFNLAPELDGDTIATVDFLLPDGLTEVSSSNTTKTATIFLTGAECGRVYRVTCRYTTAGGRTRDRTIRIRGAEQ
jgi:hypothetical protein